MPAQPLAQVPDDAVWHWQEKGNCRTADPTLFFHPQNERGSTRRQRDAAAKSVCSSCPVRVECADYAIRAREPYGVWDGMTEEEREDVYAMIDRRVGGSRAYPRERGAGALMAAEAIDRAVSARSARDQSVA